MSLLPNPLLWSLCALTLGLTACVAPTRIGGAPGLSIAPPGAFSMAARFSLQFIPPDAPIDAPSRNLSGKLEWRHRPESDDLLFLGPLGQGVARLNRDAGGVTLTESGGQQRHATSADELLETALGFPLPFDDLVAWSTARPGAGALVERDEQGRPFRVRESGWLLAYRYRDDQRLPARVDASLSQRVKLRLFIESWEFLP